MAHLYLRNERRRGGDDAKDTAIGDADAGSRKLPSRRLVQHLWWWCCLHGGHWSLLANTLIFLVGCIVLSGSPARVVAEAIAASEAAANASAAALLAARTNATANISANASNTSSVVEAGAVLLAALDRGSHPAACLGHGLGSLQGEFGSAANAEPLNALWVLLVFSLLVKALNVLWQVFLPFERASVLVLSASRLLRDDLATFLWLLGSFILLMFCCMYLIYPRASGFDDLDLFPSLNTWYEALHDVSLLALSGSALPLSLQRDTLLSLSGWQSFNLLLFFLMYALLSITLLLNFIVALFTFTFSGVRRQSTLRSRQLFAQCLLRWELIASSLGWPTAVGRLEPSGERVFEFRSVTRAGAAHAGGGRAIDGSDDPFDPFDESELGDGDEVSRRLTMLEASHARTSRVLSEQLEGLHRAVLEIRKDELGPHAKASGPTAKATGVASLPQRAPPSQASPPHPARAASPQAQVSETPSHSRAAVAVAEEDEQAKAAMTPAGEAAATPTWRTPQTEAPTLLLPPARGALAAEGAPKDWTTIEEPVAASSSAEPAPTLAPAPATALAPAPAPASAETALVVVAGPTVAEARAAAKARAAAEAPLTAEAPVPAKVTSAVVATPAAEAPSAMAAAPTA